MALPEPVLEPLGLNAIDESIYRRVLEVQGPSEIDLAAWSGSDAVSLRASLARLESAGLISRSADGETVLPIPPEPAIEALVHRRREELSRVLVAAAEMQEMYRQVGHQRDLSDLVEIVVGRDAVAKRFEQLQMAARESLWAMMRPPWPKGPIEVDPAQNDVLARGIVCRGIYDASALDHPGELHHMSQVVEHGEQVRIIDNIPAKLVGFDHSAVLVRAGVDDPEMKEGALIVHASPLLDLLHAAFELSWQSATPFGSHARKSTESQGALSQEIVEVLSLMVDGVSDQAIRNRLGISRATLSRRIQSAMGSLGARSRAHAAALAIRTGLLE